MYAVKVIKENAINGDKELWLGGVPFTFLNLKRSTGGVYAEIRATHILQ